MEDKIYNLLVKKDEITWQTIIYELIKSGEINPWDIDISKLSARYISAIKNLQEHNFFISGKMVLASAILLRIKSDRLLNEHLAEFDTLLYPPEEDLLLEDTDQDYKYAIDGKEFPRLLIKTPQARKRQVTLNELMKALEKALEVDERRRIKRLYEEPLIEEAVMPKNFYNISDLIKSVYEKVVYLFTKKQTLNFSDLLETDTKEDKVMTFIPLLHLTTQQKIDIEQEEPFSEIKITLLNGD
ncbi:MAG: ScpA family protein [Nanoarchaeota archaeon]|nr:ScpA family protein [Nanoarchaeota archaeon]